MKIVQVVNAMISQKAKISDVLKSGTEYFFIFNEKYKWSISKDDEDFYFLNFYAETDYNLAEIAKYKSAWDNIDYITYSDKEIKTREASESFRELYQIVMEKLFDLDSIFEDIIGIDDLF